MYVAQQINQTMLRNSLFCIIFLLAIAAPVFAQEEESYHVDASVGFNSIWILNQDVYGNSELDYSTTFGLTGTGGVTYFQDKWAYGAALGYMRLGQYYTGNMDGYDATRKLRFNYINLPVTAYRKMGNYNSGWLGLGLEFLFLTSAQQEFFREGTTEPLANLTYGTNDLKSRFKGMDVALKFSYNKYYRLRFNDNFLFKFGFDSGLGLIDLNQGDWQIANRKGVYKSSHNFYLGLRTGLLFKFKAGR